MTPTPRSVPPRRDLRVSFSPHADDAMYLRGVSRAEVERTVRDPEVRYDVGPKYPAGYRMHQRGNLAVVVNPTSSVFIVVTVLWRTEQQWTDEQMKAR